MVALDHHMDKRSAVLFMLAGFTLPIFHTPEVMAYSTRQVRFVVPIRDYKLDPAYVVEAVGRSIDQFRTRLGGGGGGRVHIVTTTVREIEPMAAYLKASGRCDECVAIHGKLSDDEKKRRLDIFRSTSTSGGVIITSPAVGPGISSTNTPALCIVLLRSGTSAGEDIAQAIHRERAQSDLVIIPCEHGQIAANAPTVQFDGLVDAPPPSRTVPLLEASFAADEEEAVRKLNYANIQRFVFGMALPVASVGGVSTDLDFYAKFDSKAGLLYRFIPVEPSPPRGVDMLKVDAVLDKSHCSNIKDRFYGEEIRSKTELDKLHIGQTFGDGITKDNALDYLALWAADEKQNRRRNAIPAIIHEVGRAGGAKPVWEITHIDEEKSEEVEQKLNIAKVHVDLSYLQKRIAFFETRIKDKDIWTAMVALFGADRCTENSVGIDEIDHVQMKRLRRRLLHKHGNTQAYQVRCPRPLPIAPQSDSPRVAGVPAGRHA